jgi:hypothetical protein
MTRFDHDDLWRACQHLPEDYAPWGQADREQAAEHGRLDCSSGCRWYVPLQYPYSMDWGSCCSPTSPRKGLLTFEHQGGSTCFEANDQDDGE